MTYSFPILVPLRYDDVQAAAELGFVTYLVFLAAASV